MDQFKIYVEQLRDGSTEAIAESFSPDFLEIQEKDLAFRDPIQLDGAAYLADEMLVLHLDMKTYAIIPCLICNEPVKVKIVIKGFYHAVPLIEIKGGVYNFKDILRETILLETPSLAECCQGNCPQRQEIQKYLKKDDPKKNAQDEGYNPFADLRGCLKIQGSSIFGIILAAFRLKFQGLEGI